MHDTSDLELLRRYADHGVEDAFTELVRRHCDLVWAAARRVIGDGDAARDVAQTVFTDLARQAARLPAGIVLAGWLYRVACHAASKHVRGESRRIQREQQAMQRDHLHPATDEARVAAELQPVLDVALSELTEADRDAVVLRFLAGRSLAEVGAALGASEDAAQKRVSRALEKLREAFRRRGVTVSGGTLAVTIGVAGMQTAPAGLAATVASGALEGVAAAAGTAPWLFPLKSKLVLGLAAGAVVVTVLVLQQRHLSRLAEDNVALRQQIASVPPLPVAAASHDTGELERLRGEHAELLRLRGELASVRRSMNATWAARSGVAQDRSPGLEAADPLAPGSEFTVKSIFVPLSGAGGTTPSEIQALPTPREMKAVRIGQVLEKDKLRDAGDLSPIGLVESVLWSAQKGDTHRFTELLSENSSALPLEERDAAKAELLQKIAVHLDGTDRVELESLVISAPDTRDVLVRLVPEGPKPGPHINFHVQQENGIWRLENFAVGGGTTSGKP